MRTKLVSALAILSLIGVLPSATRAQTPLGTSWTYQGRLSMQGNPLNDTADFYFTLWDAAAGGNAIGSPIAVDDVLVIDGVFTVDLDFGVMAFNGDARWLEIAVRSPHDPTDTQAYTTLAPRQALTATPYALQTRGMIVDATENVVHHPNLNNAIGVLNSISGGSGNQINAVGATIAGGQGNMAGNEYATVSGGRANGSGGPYTVVAGGLDNLAAGNAATVGGGLENGAGADYATVPGGQHNFAAGTHSFAAGHNASAVHANTFVWSDGTVFDSSAPSQFLISASAGVGINKSNPSTALDVNGTVTATAFLGDGSGLTDLPSVSDDLGDHTATQTLDMAAFDIENVGAITATEFSGHGLNLQYQVATLDQEHATIRSLPFMREPQWWQSFTASLTGALVQIDLNRRGQGEAATVNIYAGEGVGGTLLATTSLPASPEQFAVFGWQSVEFPNPTQVQAGSVYTIELVGGELWWAHNENDPYLDGRSLNAGWDMWFRTFVTGSNPATTLVATPVGTVGIRRTPTMNVLEVEGDASKSTAGDWLSNSDQRIKTDIETVADALDTLDRVRLVSFKYTDDYRSAHAGVSDGRYLNVIAQEFASVFPDHVKSSGEQLADGSEILQVDTYPLTIYSAAAIQELRKEKDDEIAVLMDEIAALMDEMVAKDTELRVLRANQSTLTERLDRIETMLESSRTK